MRKILNESLLINSIGFADDLGGAATDGGSSVVTCKFCYPEVCLRSAEFTRGGSSLAADDNRHGWREFPIDQRRKFSKGRKISNLQSCI